MSNFFAENIKTLRKVADKTQTEIADDLILGRATWASYEEGRAKPDLDRLIIIAKYFKITIDQLLTTKL